MAHLIRGCQRWGVGRGRATIESAQHSHMARSSTCKKRVVKSFCQRARRRVTLDLWEAGRRSEMCADCRGSPPGRRSHPAPSPPGDSGGPRPSAGPGRTCSGPPSGPRCPGRPPGGRGSTPRPARRDAARREQRAEGCGGGDWSAESGARRVERESSAAVCRSPASGERSRPAPWSRTHRRPSGKSSPGSRPPGSRRRSSSSSFRTKVRATPNNSCDERLHGKVWHSIV